MNRNSVVIIISALLIGTIFMSLANGLTSEDQEGYPIQSDSFEERKEQEETIGSILNVVCCFAAAIFIVVILYFTVRYYSKHYCSSCPDTVLSKDGGKLRCSKCNRVYKRKFTGSIKEITSGRKQDDEYTKLYGSN